MNKKDPKENSRLKKLDKTAEDIGMGGNLIPHITEEKYRNRMKKRKEIQTERLNLMHPDYRYILINIRR